MNQFLNLLIVFAAIVLFTLIMIYLLLPVIFDKIISPKFNASYVYNSKDFKEKGAKVSKQNNQPTLKIDDNSGIFEISFGNNRNLINGLINLRHEGRNYTNGNFNSNKDQKILMKSINEKEIEDDLGKGTNHQIIFNLEKEDIEIVANINEYQGKNYLTFILEFPYGLNNTATGQEGELITSFPSFLNSSPNTNIFTYRPWIFCPPTRNLKVSDSPALFYDDDLNNFLISPLDGFLNTVISKDDYNRINCGFQGEIKEVPKNHSQKYIILFGKGVNDSFEVLGELLLKYNDSHRKDPYANIAVSHLSYWTCNGAYYYYQREKGLRYEDTLVSVKDYFENHKIPIKSYNFDSWWYLKHTKKIFSTVLKPLMKIFGGGGFGHALTWETDPIHFTTDLKTFHNERFNYPIIAHARRWHALSKYIQDFEFEVYKSCAVPLKKDFWNWLMKYAKESGIDIFEQDWLKPFIKDMPVLREDINATEMWLNSMATSAKENDVEVFYCMQKPGMILYSLKHSNINIARSSGDYNHRWPHSYKYVHMTQANLLFNMIGINSHQDVYKTKSIEKVRFKFLTEKYPEFKTLVQILTAGLVCPGDKKEDINWPLLKKTCRNDGLLLKPDRAITPNDLMFKKHRKYYICDTLTERGKFKWIYLLIVNIWPKRVKETTITPKELGYEASHYVLYDFFRKKMRKIKNQEEINIGKIKKSHNKYYILSPIASNGISLVGCPDKFITCSKKQFISVENTGDSIMFSIEDVKGSNAMVIAFSEKKPSEITFKDGERLDGNGDMNSWNYIESENKIEIILSFENNEVLDVKITI